MTSGITPSNLYSRAKRAKYGSYPGVDGRDQAGRGSHKIQGATKEREQGAALGAGGCRHQEPTKHD